MSAEKLTISCQTGLMVLVWGLSWAGITCLFRLDGSVLMIAFLVCVGGVGALLNFGEHRLQALTRSAETGDPKKLRITRQTESIGKVWTFLWLGYLFYFLRDPKAVPTLFSNPRIDAFLEIGFAVYVVVQIATSISGAIRQQTHNRRTAI